MNITKLIGLIAVATLSSGSTDTTLEAPFAIGCQGDWYKGDPFGENEKESSQFRRYVLDENAKRISYWNEDREMEVPICERSWQKCEIEFEPTQISGSGKLNSQGSVMVKLSRRSGFIEHLHFSRDRPTQFFMGYCDKIEMPLARPSRNKF